MKQKRTGCLTMSRRQAIGSIGLGAASLLSLGGALASTPKLHHRIAQKVRALKADKAVALRLLAPSGSEANLAPVLSAFQEMTGVKVHVTLVNLDDISAELSLDVIGQKGSYDIALPATFSLPDLVVSGALRPISDFVQVHEPRGFRNNILYSVGDTFDGQTYGYQADGDAYLMFYNKAFVNNADNRKQFEDQFGASLELPRSWEELDRQMAFFHRPDDGQYGGLLFRTPSYLAWEWWVRLHGKGMLPFSKDMDPMVASDEGVSALVDLIKATEYLHPGHSQFDIFENWETYAEGNTYCNIGWGGTQKFLNRPGSPMRGNLLHAAAPGGAKNGVEFSTAYFNWGWNYVVVANTRNPEIAYLFTLFASTPDMSTQAIRQADGFFDPFRPEHYEDDQIKQTYTETFLNVHKDSLQQAIPSLYLKDRGEYFRVLSEGLNSALAQQETPEKALQRVARRWDLITSSAGRAAQIKRWAALRRKYPDTIKSALGSQI